MRLERFTYWQDGEVFRKFLNDYPDYCSQGESKKELIENLKSLLEDLKSGEVMGATAAHAVGACPGQRAPDCPPLL